MTVTETKRVEMTINDSGSGANPAKEYVLKSFDVQYYSLRVCFAFIYSLLSHFVGSKFTAPKFLVVHSQTE